MWAQLCLERLLPIFPSLVRGNAVGGAIFFVLVVQKLEHPAPSGTVSIALNTHNTIPSSVVLFRVEPLAASFCDLAWCPTAANAPVATSVFQNRAQRIQSPGFCSVEPMT